MNRWGGTTDARAFSSALSVVIPTSSSFGCISPVSTKASCSNLSFFLVFFSNPIPTMSCVWSFASDKKQKQNQKRRGRSWVAITHTPTNHHKKTKKKPSHNLDVCVRQLGQNMWVCCRQGSIVLVFSPSHCVLEHFWLVVDWDVDGLLCLCLHRSCQVRSQSVIKFDLSFSTNSSSVKFLADALVFVSRITHSPNTKNNLVISFCFFESVVVKVAQPFLFSSSFKQTRSKQTKKKAKKEKLLLTSKTKINNNNNNKKSEDTLHFLANLCNFFFHVLKHFFWLQLKNWSFFFCCFWEQSSKMSRVVGHQLVTSSEAIVVLHRIVVWFGLTPNSKKHENSKRLQIDAQILSGRVWVSWMLSFFVFVVVVCFCCCCGLFLLLLLWFVFVVVVVVCFCCCCGLFLLLLLWFVFVVVVFVVVGACCCCCGFFVVVVVVVVCLLLLLGLAVVVCFCCCCLFLLLLLLGLVVVVVACCCCCGLLLLWFVFVVVVCCCCCGGLLWCCCLLLWCCCCGLLLCCWSVFLFFFLSQKAAFCCCVSACVSVGAQMDFGANFILNALTQLKWVEEKTRFSVFLCCCCCCCCCCCLHFWVVISFFVLDVTQVWIEWIRRLVVHPMCCDGVLFSEFWSVYFGTSPTNWPSTNCSKSHHLTSDCVPQSPCSSLWHPKIQNGFMNFVLMFCLFVCFLFVDLFFFCNTLLLFWTVRGWTNERCWWTWFSNAGDSSWTDTNKRRFWSNSRSSSSWSPKEYCDCMHLLSTTHPPTSSSSGKAGQRNQTQSIILLHKFKLVFHLHATGVRRNRTTLDSSSKSTGGGGDGNDSRGQGHGGTVSELGHNLWAQHITFQFDCCSSVASICVALGLAPCSEFCEVCSQVVDDWCLFHVFVLMGAFVQTLISLFAKKQKTSKRSWASTKNLSLERTTCKTAHVLHLLVGELFWCWCKLNKNLSFLFAFSFFCADRECTWMLCIAYLHLSQHCHPANGDALIQLFNSNFHSIQKQTCDRWQNRPRRWDSSNRPNILDLLQPELEQHSHETQRKNNQKTCLCKMSVWFVKSVKKNQCIVCYLFQTNQLQGKHHTHTSQQSHSREQLSHHVSSSLKHKSPTFFCCASQVTLCKCDHCTDCLIQKFVARKISWREWIWSTCHPLCLKIFFFAKIEVLQSTTLSTFTHVLVSVLAASQMSFPCSFSRKQTTTHIPKCVCVFFVWIYWEMCSSRGFLWSNAVFWIHKKMKEHTISFPSLFLCQFPNKDFFCWPFALFVPTGGGVFNITFSHTWKGKRSLSCCHQDGVVDLGRTRRIWTVFASGSLQQQLCFPQSFMWYISLSLTNKHRLCESVLWLLNVLRWHKNLVIWWLNQICWLGCVCFFIQTVLLVAGSCGIIPRVSFANRFSWFWLFHKSHPCNVSFGFEWVCM